MALSRCITKKSSSQLACFKFQIKRDNASKRETSQSSVGVITNVFYHIIFLPSLNPDRARCLSFIIHTNSIKHCRSCELEHAARYHRGSCPGDIHSATHAVSCSRCEGCNGLQKTSPLALEVRPFPYRITQPVETQMSTTTKITYARVSRLRSHHRLGKKRALLQNKVRLV